VGHRRADHHDEQKDHQDRIADVHVLALVSLAHIAVYGTVGEGSAGDRQRLRDPSVDHLLVGREPSGGDLLDVTLGAVTSVLLVLQDRDVI
jgi:hypothetical protein